MAPTALPEDVKKRAEAIAKKKGWTVQDLELSGLAGTEGRGCSRSMTQQTRRSGCLWRMT